MKFEFDTRTDTAKDAAALAAALAVLHGPAVAEALEGAADGLAVDGRPFDQVSALTNLLGSASPEDRARAEAYRLAKETNSVRFGGEADTSAAGAFGEHLANTPPTPPPAPARGTLDTAGIPWDERIHASTKTTNKDGTWTRRRNTDDALFDKVMAELKGQSKEPNAAEAFAPETPASPPAPTEPVAPPPPPAPPAASETVVPPPPTETAASPVPPPPPAPPAGSDPITFPKLMVKITKAQTAQTIDAAKVVEFLGMFGLSAVKELASAPAETIQAVNDLVDAHVGA